MMQQAILIHIKFCMSCLVVESERGMSNKAIVISDFVYECTGFVAVKEWPSSKPKCLKIILMLCCPFVSETSHVLIQSVHVHVQPEKRGRVKSQPAQPLATAMLSNSETDKRFYCYLWTILKMTQK